MPAASARAVQTKRRRWLAYGGLAVLALAIALVYLGGRRSATPVSTEPTFVSPMPASMAEFVGSNACASCHADEHAKWRGSQHAAAMQHASTETVHGDFAHATFRYAGVTSTFFQRDGKFLVRTDGPDGKLADFEVKYTFGIAPLQQYLVELPGGRLQALSIAWDTRPKAEGGERWFHLYARERIDFGDELHWTRRAQNWNFMCADCHSTNVRKGFDPAQDAFDTRYSEMTVGCEACHGPGSAHIVWAKERTLADARKGLTVALDERKGATWSIDATTGNALRNRERGTDREIEVCAPCHARRAQIAEGYRAGAPFLDHYLPATLTPGLYHADGQQLDEVYIWGSFLQSKMHRRGVTCSDCHEPHTQKLRAEGNILCGQCHAPTRYDVAAHHHHRPGTRGAQCVNCHMPASTYMVVDPRRDHGMRVPRPDLSLQLGVPNACNDCHRERNATWAAEAVARWHGPERKGFQTFASAFRAAETSGASAAASLAAVASDPAQSAIVRASALERLARFSGTRAVTLARDAARDVDPLVRLGAVHLTAALPPSERVAIAGPLLSDPLRAVRIEAARVLAGTQSSAPGALQQEAWTRAADEFVATQRHNADRPESLTALGSFYAALGRFDEAQAEYAAALRGDRAFVPAYLNSADAYRVQGREADARRMLESGLAQAPDNAALHHALGLALVRGEQRAAALGALRRASELAPGEARYTYVYAVALHSLGRAKDAIGVLERATKRWPGDRDILLARVSFLREAGRMDAARATAQAFIAAHPDDPAAQAAANAVK